MRHPSPIVQAGKKQGIKTTAVQFLQAGLSRRSALASETDLTLEEAQALNDNVSTFRRLLEAWSTEMDPACNDWNFTMTSIVARKAVFLSEREDWMTAKQ